MAITKFNVVEGLTVGGLVQIPVIDNTANVSANNLNVQGDSNLGNLATANYFTGNGRLLSGITLANTIADVSITSPTNGQTLIYNGLVWVNTNTGAVSAGQGVSFWLSTPIINAINANNAIQVDSLSSTPNTSAQTYANVTVNGTAAIAGFVSPPLNRTSWDAGNWDFSIWANISATGGTNTLNAGIHQILPNAGTVTTTGTGTTRTATASTGTPFANVVAGSNVILSSYIQTPQGLYRITAKTSDTVVSINVPTTYTNETTVSASVWVPLFNIGSADMSTTSLFEYNFTTTEPAWPVTTNSSMGLLLAATTSSSKSVYVTINGTNQASHFTTPLATLHDQLAGLQGGQIDEYYHLTYNEYAGTGTGNFVRQSNANLINPNIDSATGLSLTLTGNLVSGNANLGNLAVANYVTGTLTTGNQPNITSLGTLSGLTSNGIVNFTTASNVSLGDVSNLKILGGTAGYVLKTDGTGNLSWGIDTTAAAGNNTYVQFNDGGSLGGNANFTFDKSTSLLTVTGNVNALNADLGNLVAANFFSGNGSLLSSITGGNVTGQVGNALVAGTVYTNAQPNITSLGTLTSLSVSGNASFTGANTYFSNIANVKIPGGSNGYVLKTDGAGNLSWGIDVTDYSNTNVAAYLPTYTGNFTAGNANISGNIISGNASLGNLATANYFSGDGSLLSNITGGNVVGQVGNALVAGTVYTNAQPNITSLGTLTSLSVTGNITSGNASLGNLATANYFSGDGSLLTSITGGNVTGQVANALIAGTVYTNAQPNITSVGNLSSLTVSGNITSGNASLGNLAVANYFNGDGSLLSSLTGSNVTGQVANALIAGTVYTNAQPNITSVGTLTSLNITGNVSSGNANLGNLVLANYFSGDGSLLSNLNVANIGTVANANYAAFAGNVTLASQPNITSVGNLSSLTVSGNTTIAGNLTVSGTTVYANVTTLNVKDPIIELGGTGNNDPLSSNDGKDRGTLLHYYTTTPIDAFMGWDNSNGEFGFGSNVTATNEVITWNSYGNIRAGYIIADGSLLTSITGGNVTGQVGNALIAGTVYTNAQPNITSLGTLSSLSVTGNISAGNANLGNLVTANYFIGDGSLLSNLNTANIGTVANANYAAFAGNVVLASQPNITSLGTLVSLSVTGNITSGNANLGNLAVANYFSGNGSLLTSITGGNVTGQVGNALIAGTVYTNAQPNITSVGTLQSTTLAANANLTLSGSLSQITGANLVSASLLTGTLTTAAQPNITSLGTLGNLTVTANASAGNILTNNLLYSNGTPWNLNGTYSNTNVAAYLPTYTGNLTAGNANISGNIFGNNGTLTGALLLGSGSGGNISGANVVTANLFTGTLTTGAQPNITSLGTLASLTVTANISSGNANLGNLVVANFFSGNGALLTSITGANVTGQVGNALVSGTVYTNAQPNITSVGTLTSLSVTGNVSAGNANLGNLARANFFSGDGGFLSNINPSNIGTVANANYAAFAGNVTLASQPNITSVGNLASLTVSGNTTIAGNLTVSGTTIYANVSTLNVKDPIIELGGTGNNDPLTSNDGKDRGTLLHYYTTAPVDAFMGWDNSNAEFGFGSNVTVTNEVVTWNSYGNIRANYFIGNGALLTGMYSNTNVAAYLPTYTGNVAANYFIGNGSALTSITGANVTGQVANALIAGTVYTAAQPNITSVGTLSSLTVSGLITATGTGIKVANIYDSTTTLTIETKYGNIAGDAGVYGNLTVGTSGAGNITAYNANLGNLVIGNFLQGTLTTGAQPNITSVGTLGNLSVTANASAGNILTNNLLYANGTPWSFGDVYSNANVANYLPTYTGNFTAGNISVTGSVIGNAVTANYVMVTERTTGNYYPTFVSSNSSGNYALGANADISYDAGNSTLYISKLSSGSGNGGTISGANLVSANFFQGDGGLLSNISASNVASANYSNFAGTVITAAQPNITSLGTLSNLSVTGNVSAGNILTDSLLYANGVAWSFGSTYSNANVANYLPTYTGNLQAGNFTLNSLGTGQIAISSSGLIVGGPDLIWDFANSALTITNLKANGVISTTSNVTASNANLGNLVTANYFTGNASLLSSITGGNVTGQVGNALLAGTVYTNAQPNITSLGNLSGLTSNGVIDFNNSSNVTLGNVSNLHIAGGSLGYVLKTDGAGNLSWGIDSAAAGGSNTEVQFNDNNSLAGSANFTFNKTTNTLSVTNIIGNGAGITYITGSNVNGQVGNALVAGTVYTNAQPNITSLGTLSSLSVTANVSAGNIKSDNLLYANGTPYVFTTNAAGSNTQIQFNDGNAFAGSANLTFNKATNTLTAYNFVTTNANVNGIANLGSVSNVKITGGSAGYTLTTDGLGNLSWQVGAGGGAGFVNINKDNFVGNGVQTNFTLSTVPSAEAALQVNIDGLIQQDWVYSLSGSTLIFSDPPANNANIEVTIYGAITISGANTQVLFIDGSNVNSNSNFTFNKTTSTLSVSNLSVTGNVSSGNLSATSGLLTLGSGTIEVSGSNAGIFTVGIGNTNIGLAGNVTLGSASGNVTVQGNLSVANTATITNLKVNDFYSNRTPIVVTTGTVVDSFSTTKYRSAKYTMRVNSDDGYQAVEVLLIHNGTNSFVTIYGSLSTIGSDIITLSTDINSGNVRMLATTLSANTTVNLLGTYVSD